MDANGKHWTHQMMYWRAGSKVAFNAANETYEHQTVFYNYDNTAWAVEATGWWQSDMPDPYQDTQWLNDTNVAGNPNEYDITVGTFDPDLLVAEQWYYSEVELTPTSSASSFYKISGQSGYTTCPSLWCVLGEGTAIYIPYKTGFTAPERKRNFKYEWESNNTMDAAADGIYVNDWGSGTISSATDVDYWDFNVYYAQTIKFLMNVPDNTSIDYDVNVYNDAGAIVAQGHLNGGQDESFSAYLPVGHYYIKVYSYSGYDANVQYQILPYNDCNC